MNRAKIALLALGLCACSTSAWANDIEPGKEFYTAIKVTTPIVLDGDLSEWTGANVLADPRFSIPKGSGDGGTLVNFELNGGDWTGPDDHTSAVRVVYDDDNVYFGFVVTDEYHENAANSSWNGDSVQLMIANDLRDTQVGLYNYALGGVEGAIGDLLLQHEAGPAKDNPDFATEAVVVRNAETKRTIYEIKLPKGALDLDELKGGVQFGLGMAINDGDEATPGQKGWGGLGAHSIVFGKSPEETALVTLATPSPPTGTNDIEFGKEFYTAIKATEPIVLDGDLGEWTGAAPLADPRFAIPKGAGDTGTLVNFELNGGDWTGPDDHTSAVRVVYDDDNVYFGFVVTDDYHENAANSSWNGDSVQLMIANDTRDSQVALYNYALGGVEGAIGDLLLQHEAGPAKDNPDFATEAVVVRNAQTKRTTYEIKLPKGALDLEELRGGVKFGLGMAINDGDELTPGQKGWGGLGAHSIVFGKSPEQTALVTLATANDIEPGKEFHSAKRPPSGKITLDGNLADWQGVPILSDPRFSIPKGGGSRGGDPLTLFELNGGDWTGPDDHTSAVQVAYDDDNVYFAFLVTDEYHENAANSSWNGDSVQLMIANDAQDTQVALYNYALGGVDGAIGDLLLQHEAGPAKDNPDFATEAVVLRDADAKRTVYEIKLPKGSLGLTELKSGVQFGLGMSINDGDELTPGQKGWGGLGAHSIVFGKTPEQTALITLDGYVPPTEPCFLSAIATGLNTFTFRGNDFDDCVVDPAQTTLVIDGQQVELVAGPNVNGATDFTHTFDEPFSSRSEHSYTIEMRDTEGNVVATETSTWTAPIYGLLTPDMKVADVDTTMPGFVWRIFANGLYTHTSLAKAEQALIGELLDDFEEPVIENEADPMLIPGEESPALGDATVVRPIDNEDFWLLEFEIPGVINLSATAVDFGGPFGNFEPDEQMPGLPSLFFINDGADAEAVTYVEFPAGFISLGVNSDDGFRMESAGQVLGEFDGGRGAADTIFDVNVLEAGIYPIRVLWVNGGGDANIEIFSVKEDETKVLINDRENGGLRAFRALGGGDESFHITGLVYDPIVSAVMVTWESTPGSTYRIEWSETLLPESWTELADGFPEGGAVGATTEYVDTTVTANSKKRYYRVIKE